jgi:hypothetical protein
LCGPFFLPGPFAVGAEEHQLEAVAFVDKPALLVVVALLRHAQDVGIEMSHRGEVAAEIVDEADVDLRRGFAFHKRTPFFKPEPKGKTIQVIVI